MASNSHSYGPWRSSSRCGAGGTCVQVRLSDNSAQVRDGKNPSGPALSFEREPWHSFIQFVREHS